MDIYPSEGIGEFLLGATSSEIAARTKTFGQDFKRNQFQQHKAEYFPQHGLFVYYDAQERSEAIEVASGSAELHGVEMLGAELRAVLPHITRLDPTVTLSDDGLTSKPLGIALYVPAARNVKRAKVESVLVFAPGYYD